VFVAVAAGATMATTILVSQYYGAKEFDKVTRTVGTSFTLAIVLGVALSAGGIFASDWILALLGTPASIVPQASPYLKISFAGFTIMYMSFLVSSILRGVGDTKTPLLFMGVGVVVNIVLDPLLIIGVGPFPRMGLNGAAVASILSSAVGLVLGLTYLNRKAGIITFRLSAMRLDREMAALIVKIGFPSMLQQSAVSLGMATVTSIINGFGASATAAFGAAGRIDQLAFFPAMSIGMAVSAIAGQNIGAGKIDRVRQTFRWGVLMTVCISAFLSIFFLGMPHILLSAFLTDAEVIKLGGTYLRIVGPTSVMFAIMFVSNGIINGAGHTITTLVFTIFAVWCVRVPAAMFLAKTSLGLTGVWFGFALGFAGAMAISLIWYKTGRWQKSVIRHGATKGPTVLPPAIEEPPPAAAGTGV